MHTPRTQACTAKVSSLSSSLSHAAAPTRHLHQAHFRHVHDEGACSKGLSSCRTHPGQIHANRGNQATQQQAHLGMLAAPGEYGRCGPDVGGP